MQVTLAHIGSRAGAKDGYEALVSDYLKRCSPVVRPNVETFRAESALLEWLRKQRGRTEAALLMLDGRGRPMSVQHVVFAVGPADGWSPEALAEGKRRGGLLSLGPMTLAHQLARLVVAEQLYRACTILTGHPYHRG